MIYLRIPTIQNIQKFKSIISTSKLGMEIIYVTAKFLGAMPKVKTDSVACFIERPIGPELSKFQITLPRRK